MRHVLYSKYITELYSVLKERLMLIREFMIWESKTLGYFKLAVCKLQTLTFGCLIWCHDDFALCHTVDQDMFYLFRVIHWVQI